MIGSNGSGSYFGISIFSGSTYGGSNSGIFKLPAGTIFGGEIVILMEDSFRLDYL
ncbi:MAG: hypothetical protein NTU63_04185 [Candidatus Pacearchaeota archaeon]|nr:hypothetical protein [Candidatus Pacearchaeota archaeon]